jgi:hypothetical protein
MDVGLAIAATELTETVAIPQGFHRRMRGEMRADNTGTQVISSAKTSNAPKEGSNENTTRLAEDKRA